MVVVSQGQRKYVYKVNFSAAVDICLTFFRYSGFDPPDVITLIARYLTPMRERWTMEENVVEGGRLFHIQNCIGDDIGHFAGVFCAP